LVIYESTAFGAVLAAAEVGLPVACLDLWAVGRWHVDRRELEARVRAVWADRTDAPLLIDPISGMAHLDPAPPALRSADDHDRTRVEMQQVAWGDPALPLSPWISGERSRPLVYLTLGTVGWGTVGVLQECLSGLSGLPVDVLVAVGAYFDPADLGSLPKSIHVERFVRQDLLLRATTIAVHHGGSGTLLGAAAHGVPQLVMPMGADQFQNAEALVRAGAGLALSHGGVTAQAVHDGVLELLEEPSYRTLAGELRSEIQAMPTPAATIPRLVALAQSPR
jgi:Erythromycin biosynthesis protein CIII-like, C-terminal domain